LPCSRARETCRQGCQVRANGAIHASHNRERDALCMVGHISNQPPAGPPATRTERALRRRSTNHRGSQVTSPDTHTRAWRVTAGAMAASWICHTKSISLTTHGSALAPKLVTSFATKKRHRLEMGVTGRPNSHLAGLLMFRKRSRGPPLRRTSATG